MIEASNLEGVAEPLALRIIAHAISIAPGLDTIPEDTTTWKRVIAVLIGVAQEARARGSRLIGSQGVGPASISYRNVDSWFSTDDKTALRAACSPISTGAAPLGSFPRPGIMGRLWPEDYS